MGGAPACVDTSRHLFWFLIGHGVNQTRELMAVDMVSGKIAVERPLSASNAIYLIAYCRACDELWAVGLQSMQRDGGTIALYQLEVATGNVMSTSVLDGLGNDWNINTLPGIVTIDEEAGEIVFPASQRDSLAQSGNVFLVRVPLTNPKAATRPTKAFCHIKTRTTEYDCPKALSYYRGAGVGTSAFAPTLPALLSTSLTGRVTV